MCSGTWQAIGDDGISGQITCTGSLKIEIQNIAPVNNKTLRFAGTDNQARNVRGWVGRFGDIESLVQDSTFERLTNVRTCYVKGYGHQPPDKN